MVVVCVAITRVVFLGSTHGSEGVHACLPAQLMWSRLPSEGVLSVAWFGWMELIKLFRRRRRLEIDSLQASTFAAVTFGADSVNSFG